MARKSINAKTSRFCQEAKEICYFFSENNRQLVDEGQDEVKLCRQGGRLKGRRAEEKCTKFNILQGQGKWLKSNNWCAAAASLSVPWLSFNGLVEVRESNFARRLEAASEDFCLLPVLVDDAFEFDSSAANEEAVSPWPPTTLKRPQNSH